MIWKKSLPTRSASCDRNDVPLKGDFGHFITLFGRLIVPSPRLDIVLRYATAILIKRPKANLGLGITLLGG